MLKQLAHVNAVGARPGRGARVLHREARDGASRRRDACPEMGNFRWLTVGPVGQPDIAVVLMAVPGPPVFDEETAAQLQDAGGEGSRGRPLLHDGRLPGRPTRS